MTYGKDLEEILDLATLRVNPGDDTFEVGQVLRDFDELFLK